jgi:hypothetical protein
MPSSLFLTKPISFNLSLIFKGVDSAYEISPADSSFKKRSFDDSGCFEHALVPEYLAKVSLFQHTL